MSNHAHIQEFLQGGAGGFRAWGPTFSMGGGGGGGGGGPNIIGRGGGGGVQMLIFVQKPIELVIFQGGGGGGGSGPLSLPLDPHMQTIWIQIRCRVKSESYMCRSRGGIGGPDPPWKITSYMGFYRN